MYTADTFFQKTPPFTQGVFLFVALVALDQLIKLTVVLRDVPYICNEGIAFGIVLPPLLFFACWVVLVGSFLFVWHKKRFESLVYTLPYILVVSGGTANLLDRIFYGCVVDYIPFFNISLFNLADSFILCGALLIIVYSLKR